MEDIDVYNVMYCNIQGTTYPVIEEIDRSKNRYILLNSIALLCKTKTNILKKSISNFKDDLSLSDHMIDLKEEVLKDDKFRSKLLLRRVEVPLNSNGVFAFDKIGCENLLSRVRMLKFISEDILLFFDNDTILKLISSDELSKIYLDLDGVNRVLKSFSQNNYIKQVKKAIAVPKQSENALKLNVEIRKFNKLILEEAFDELMQILKIENKNSIKSFLLDECMSFMENGYILSDNMMQEFNSLKYKVDIIRKEYLELCESENVKKKSEIISKIKERDIYD